MKHLTLEALVKVISAPDFKSWNALDDALFKALRKALQPEIKETWNRHKEFITADTIEGVAKELKIKAGKINNGLIYLGRVLPKAYAAGQDQTFHSRLEEEAIKEQEARGREELGENQYHEFKSGRTYGEQFDTDWMKKTCKRLGLPQPKGRSKASLFKDGLRKIYRAQMQDEFWSVVQTSTETYTNDESNLSAESGDIESFYYRVCGRDVPAIVNMLDERFPVGSQFESDFKAFLSKFGLSAKKMSRDNWLRRVADELSSRTGAGGIK